MTVMFATAAGVLFVLIAGLFAGTTLRLSSIYSDNVHISRLSKASGQNPDRVRAALLQRAVFSVVTTLVFLAVGVLLLVE